MHRVIPASRKLVVFAGAFLLAGCIHEAGPSPEPYPAAVAADEQRSAASPDAEGFVALHLADFQPFPADAHSWSEDGEIIATTGQPRGYLHSQATHRNFTWRGEFRFVPAEGQTDPANEQSNTGFMLCIQEPHKIWPRSLEVQGKHVEMAQIKSNGGVPALTISDDPASREAARRPVGEWNSLEIQCRDGAVTATLNAAVVCQSEPGEVVEGLIGLQSENFSVQFRNLRIRDD